MQELGLKQGASDKPCRMDGRVPLMVHKGETAIYIFQFHQYHGTGTIVTTTRDKPLTMSMHNHEHTPNFVGYDFAVVTCAVQYGICAF